MTTQITPGIYKLTQDIKNPNRDRRLKYDWNKGEFKEGMLFKVTEERVGTLRFLRIMRADTYHDVPFEWNHPLRGYLEPITDPSWAAVLYARHVGLLACCGEVIDLLIERGVLTSEQFISAYEEVLNRDC